MDDKWRGWSLNGAQRVHLVATGGKCSGLEGCRTKQNRCHRLRGLAIGARSSRSNRGGRLISVVSLVHEKVARREVDALLAAVAARERT